MFANRAIESAPDNYPVSHHDRTNRNFTQTLGGTSLRQGFAHEILVAENDDGHFFIYSHSIVAGGLPDTS
jgi:hypothetical protein